MEVGGRNADPMCSHFPTRDMNGVKYSHKSGVSRWDEISSTWGLDLLGEVNRQPGLHRVLGST